MPPDVGERRLALFIAALLIGAVLLGMRVILLLVVATWDMVIKPGL